jgi:hypothetical protein
VHESTYLFNSGVRVKDKYNPLPFSMLMTTAEISKQSIMNTESG